MKQRRFPKRKPADADWVTSPPQDEEHHCAIQVDWSNGPECEPVLCGKPADVLMWWDGLSKPLPCCFEHYEELAKGRSLNEYGKAGK